MEAELGKEGCWQAAGTGSVQVGLLGRACKVWALTTWPVHSSSQDLPHRIGAHGPWVTVLSPHHSPCPAMYLHPQVSLMHHSHWALLLGSQPRPELLLPPTPQHRQLEPRSRGWPGDLRQELSSQWERDVLTASRDRHENPWNQNGLVWGTPSSLPPVHW